MGATLHILVVDDRPDSVLFLTEFLLSRRHRVETCNHASEALEAIVRRHRTTDSYDLLISDVSMPGMDGLALLREIRRRQMLLPVALYTAYGSMHPNLASQAQALGCLGVLEKPIELRRVEALLDEVIARRQGTARHGTARHGTGRHGTGRHATGTSDQDQPFFGTSRVARTSTSSTTTAHRRETNQPVDFDQPASGGYALEPKPVVPLPPSQPLVHHTPVPLPPLPPPRIPPPIRTPLPFPVEQQEPHTRSMPSLRTPVPQVPERRDSTGRSVNSAFRTPLPFLQSPPPMTPPTPPMIPPSVASAPPVRTPQPAVPPTIVPGNEETNSPPQPPSPTTSFIRRSVNSPTTRIARPSGIFPADPQSTNPANLSGTARIRRTVTGSYAPPTDNAPPTGRQQAPAGGGSTRAVACAHCRKVFMVGSRSSSYTAVCVHCGQLNRIDPL
jgi:CheY-like chemotaxis protein